MNEAKKKALQERRFECQRCGYCCNQKVLIYPSLEEIQKLAQYLHLSECAFALRYLQEIYDPEKDLYAIAFKTNRANDPLTGCIFCKDRICVIYDSPRTDICHVFPWNHFDLENGQWQENFVSEEGTFWCPGIGKGHLWTLEEIKRLKEDHPNVWTQLKPHYHLNPPSFLNGIDVHRPSPLILTLSEEKFLHKLRTLPIGRKREVENLLDFFYHGGHRPKPY